MGPKPVSTDQDATSEKRSPHDVKFMILRLNWIRDVTRAVGKERMDAQLLVGLYTPFLHTAVGPSAAVICGSWLEINGTSCR